MRSSRNVVDGTSSGACRRGQSVQLTVPDAAKWDPGVDWAGHPRDDSPTITLAYHGAGAFDTRLVRTPYMKQEELGLDGPH